MVIKDPLLIIQVVEVGKRSNIYRKLLRYPFFFQNLPFDGVFVCFASRKQSPGGNILHSPLNAD